MKVLVTGSDGMVGSHLVKKLEDNNHTIIKFGDDKDICNWDDWCSINDEDIDVIVHLAALAGVRPSFDDPETYYKVNVDGTRNMLEFSETLPDVRILYASSSNAYEWWGNPYAATKKMNEIQAEDYHAIGMRFHTIYPGRDDMLFRKLERGDVTYINRNHYRDFVHVEDVTDAICILMAQFDVAWMMQRVYDIGTGHVTPVEEVARLAGFDGEYRDDNPVGERTHTKADIEALLKLGFTPKRNILNEVSNSQ